MMDPYVRQVLEQAFPGEDERYFTPTVVGSTPTSADEGATAILDGSKTTTSSPFWDWPDGRIPFVGALSVLLDGKGSTRAIIETLRVEIVRFGDVDESFAWSYGEGQRTLDWWRSEIGAWYRESAARHRTSFSDETPIICEWITVVKRL
jgi:histidinol-phosphate aminotransferase